MRRSSVYRKMFDKINLLPAKRRLPAVLFMVLIILTIAFIWSNSLQSSQESLKRSDLVAELIEPVILAIPVTKWHTPQMISFITRKLGHFSEYFLLGMELMVFKFLLKPAVKFKFWQLLVFAVLVAAADESIQLTSGRGAMLQDVLLDGFGALMGLGLITVIYSLRHHAFRKARYD